MNTIVFIVLAIMFIGAIVAAVFLIRAYFRALKKAGKKVIDYTAEAFAKAMKNEKSR